jgi:hypothetical protein
VAYRLIDADPSGEAVERVTFVAFLPDGSCAALPGPELISGPVLVGESIVLDTSARVPLQTAGFYRQRVRAFAIDGTHLYAWLDGDRYTGRRPHARVDLVVASPTDLATELERAGRPAQARAVRDAATSIAALDEYDFYADGLRLLEPAYLRGRTPEAGSGFGGTAEDWRLSREMIVDGIDRDGTFLDVGCANGLLMESVHRWAAERGLHVEPYGVDLSPNLVAAARARLPQWSDRISVGNAIDHVPGDGRRFTFVHVLVDLVPADRVGAMLRHAVDVLVEPGGRLLVSKYGTAGGTDHPEAADVVRQAGFRVAGSTHADPRGRPATTAWIDRDGYPDGLV